MFVIHGTGSGSESTTAEPEPPPPFRGDVQELLLRHAGLLMLAADVTHSCSRPAACGDREPVITVGAVARLGSVPTEPAAAAVRSEKCRRRRRSRRATISGEFMAAMTPSGGLEAGQACMRRKVMPRCQAVDDFGDGAGTSAGEIYNKGVTRFACCDGRGRVPSCRRTRM